MPVKSVKQATIVASIGSSNRLTERQFSALVTSWNSKLRHQKQTIARECSEHGHDRRIAPFSTPQQTTMVCIRCLSYTTKD